MAEYLHLIRYDKDGTTVIGDLNLTPGAGVTTYKFQLKARPPSFPKWKDQIRDSAILPSKQLVDFELDSQDEVLTIDIIAADINWLQKAKGVLNDWARLSRVGQRERNAKRPYQKMKLVDRPLNTATYTSGAEVIRMTVEGGNDQVMQDRLLYRCNDVRITLELDPFWTASILDLVDAQSIDNGSGNTVVIGGDSTIYTINNVELSSNVATFTVDEDVETPVGATIDVADVVVDAAFNGTFIVSAVGAHTIECPITHGDIASTPAAAGTVSPRYVKGTGDAPAIIKVDGGSSAVNKVAVAVRAQGVPSAFTPWLWAKDATRTNNTNARNSDTTFDGGGAHNGTRTTAADTDEHLILQWLISADVLNYYGDLRGFLRCRSNTAGRYAVRGRYGLYDGTNVVYPLDGDGGYTLETAVDVGTDSGNALAWVDLGLFLQPAMRAGIATAKGLAFEIYATCSDLTSSPTFDVDGLALRPATDGMRNTGFCSAKFPLGIAASGVGAAMFNAMPDHHSAYLVDASDVFTFPALELGDGLPLWLAPGAEQVLIFDLIDESTSAGNPRHDYTMTMDVTVQHELRQGSEGRIE